MAKALLVGIPHKKSTLKNLEFGLQMGVWGFPDNPKQKTFNANRVKAYKSLQVGDLIVLASGYTGGAPRVPFDTFIEQDAVFQAFTDVCVGTITVPYYKQAVPFWTDEMASQITLYPHRFGFDDAAFVGAVSLEPGVDLSHAACEALHTSICMGSRGWVVDTIGSPLLAGGGLTTVGPLPPIPPGPLPPAPPGGQGYERDSAKRRAKDERAMRLATTVWSDDGWDVEDVSKRNPYFNGTPYDLHCTKGQQTAYVEVKGSGTTGDTVRVTAGEVAHAAAHPGQSFLHVFGGIGVKPASKGKLVGVGGSVRYHGPFPVNGTMTATEFNLVVP